MGRGDRGERKHLPLKVGEPSFELVARALTDWKRDVTIISETPHPLRDAEEMRRITEDITELSHSIS